VRPPLIAHIVHHFDVGGLENGMVNLINRIPEDRYRHAVVCMQGYSDYSRRIRHPDVRFIALDKKPGKDLGVYRRLARALRELKPDIVHTRNLSALEGQFAAAWCGVPARVHGEHGRDVFDLHGRNRKYNLLRKLARPLVHRYIALSRDLQQWLVDTVGVAPARIAQIYNGVDVERFRPRNGARGEFGPPGFAAEGKLVIGSVGRMAAVKDFPTLVRAFVDMITARPELRAKLRLAIIGEGGSRAACHALAEQAGAADIVWLPGERADVPELMRGMDLFVLPSLGEGISNTILEAMASGLPVLATRVGGNPELVEEGVTGRLIAPGNPAALAQALLDHVDDPARLARQGGAARARVEAHFSMDAMVRGYLGVYDEVLARQSK
jgi:sugar transferase (PEP-CTERM/EpsH1 system associated)